MNAQIPQRMRRAGHQPMLVKYVSDERYEQRFGDVLDTAATNGVVRSLL